MLSVTCAAGATTPALVPSDGFNLRIENVSATQIVVKLTVKNHQWFAGTFTNLPANRELTISVDMKGNDTSGNRANVAKWRGLQPVMTYADPTQYETYVWYWKDAKGRWLSGDPFVTDEARFAGTGQVPQQKVIPAELAPQFLSKDGKMWTAWREIETVTADTKANIFHIRQRFALPTATVAMRVPYTYTYLQQFLAKLEAAKLPGVTIDEIGATPEGRKLQILRLEEVPEPKKESSRVIDVTPRVPPQERPTFLLIAREHATEHASSWAIHGALLELIANSREAKQSRAAATWMLIPIEDPDGSAKAEFDRLTDRFRKPHDPKTPPEVFAYTSYFAGYINQGRTLDVAISIHNVEANESENISSPIANLNHVPATESFNQGLFKTLSATGYITGKTKVSHVGASIFRLFGWLSQHFGTLDLAYEVNDRYPQKRLLFPELQGVGLLFAKHLGNWAKSPAGQQRHQQARAILQEWERQRVAYFTQVGPAADNAERARYDLLILGYSQPQAEGAKGGSE